MRSSSLLFLSIGCVLVGCSAGDGGTLIREPAPTEPAAEDPPAQEDPPEAPPAKPADDPGPAPAGCGTITKDADGFFTRKTAKSDYVGFVPKSYSGKPTMLVVGLHGCGDSAMNFATWGVNPYDTRKTQEHIGISIGGRDGQCWDTGKDADKAIAAIQDISTCFYVHQQKVVLAGYSSGGILAYKLGLTQASKFAGIIIENSALGASPSSASWKINVAHIAHTEDTSFPIARVRADWAKLEAAGIPLQKKEIAGDHNGTSDDWTGFLLPQIKGWKAP